MKRYILGFLIIFGSSEILEASPPWEEVLSSLGSVLIGAGIFELNMKRGSHCKGFDSLGAASVVAGIASVVAGPIVRSGSVMNSDVESTLTFKRDCSNSIKDVCFGAFIGSMLIAANCHPNECRLGPLTPIFLFGGALAGGAFANAIYKRPKSYFEQMSDLVREGEEIFSDVE